MGARAMDSRLFVAITRQYQCQPVCAHGDHNPVVFVRAEDVRIRGPVSRSAIGMDGDGREELFEFFPSEKLWDAEEIGNVVRNTDCGVHFVKDSRVEGQAGCLTLPTQ